jgi:hypothetical protein
MPDIFVIPSGPNPPMVQDFVIYERISRAVVKDILLDNPFQTAKLLLWDKPVLLLKHIVNSYIPGVYGTANLLLQDQATSLAPIDRRYSERLYVRMFSAPVVLLIVISGLAVYWYRSPDMAGELILLLVLFVFATLPLMATYPLIHLMGPLLVIIQTFLILIVIFLFARLVDAVVSVGRPFLYRRKQAR